MVGILIDVMNDAFCPVTFGNKMGIIKCISMGLITEQMDLLKIGFNKVILFFVYMHCTNLGAMHIQHK